MRILLIGLLLVQCLRSSAAERVVAFEAGEGDQPVRGFQSLVLGYGGPGSWRVVNESNAPGGQPVVAQISREPLGQRAPVLLLDEVISDFKLTAKFRILGGILEQSAGMVFRFQNPSNYYVIRADANASSFRCFKVENGQVKPPIGPEMKISAGEWHTLVIQCEGTRILCGLNGNDAVKLIDNNTRKTGRIGFWTKSDTLAQFADLRMDYTPHEPLAKAIVRDALKEFPRVLGISIFAARETNQPLKIVASTDAAEMGTPGTDTESKCVSDGSRFYKRDRDSVTITMPLRDRNGDPIAAVRLRMKAFPGQTEDNAVVRALPVLKSMQDRVQSLDLLLD